MRGLYGIANAEAGGDPVALGQHMLVGGCRLIQLRCKGWAPDEVVRAGRALARACEARGALLFANDDAEVAVAMGAHGLHLGQTDGDLGAARALLPSGIVGRSTHDLEQVAAAVAEGADYLAFGPVFATPHLSRPKPVRGLEALAAVRRATTLPLVAIGGITAENVSSVRAAGADAWAVIGAIAGAVDPVDATRALLG